MIQLFRKRCTRYSLKSGIDRRKQLIAIVSIPALRSFGCPLCDMVIPILTVGGCRQCQNHRKLLALLFLPHSLPIFNFFCRYFFNLLTFQNPFKINGFPIFFTRYFVDMLTLLLYYNRYSTFLLVYVEFRRIMA